MVAGKVKKAVGLQKSPPNAKLNISPKPPPLPPPSSGKIPQKGAVFSRSFGVYFPRASAQVQPRPPDVTELLRLVEQLRERESLLKTELLEHKLMKESVAILPVLENEIASRDAEIQRNAMKIECLEAENERLREDLEVIHMKASEEKKEHEKKLKALEDEIKELKKARAESKRFVNADFVESDEMLLSQRFQIQGLLDASVKSNLIKNLKKVVKASHEFQNKRNEAVDVDNCVNHLSFNKINEDFEMKRDEFVDEIAENLSRRSRAPRVPKPPPRPASSSLSSSSSSSHSSLSIAAERVLNEDQPAVPEKTMPPPAPPSSKAVPAPPPPPPKGMKNLPGKVKRVPEVVEFYHSLMRRDSRRDPGGGATDAPAVNPRDMIGEIENRSAHLLAIKTDVETQGDFIRFLIKEVEDAAFRDIEDVVPFVKWLDDELSFLVDERAVLKHFNWPEQKADALREAAFGYCDLKKLESEASSFRDNQRQPCAPALKKMQSLFEKLEHGVHNLLRVRESATRRYNLLHIPTDWMLETGYICQIKLASVKLALKYMKRVSAELEIVGGYPEEEELIVQGVRFAFRVHQFAGGFDVETMKAFQELRDKARSCHIQCQNQQQHKYICRSTPC